MRGREYPLTKIIPALARDDLLPAIVFRTARRQCDDDIEALARFRTALLNGEERHVLRRTIEEVIHQYDMPRDVIFDHPHFNTLLSTGAGAHHAGQLLMWRLMLEELMARGVLKVMVATGTVAAGVDFPARTVVITAHSKRGSEGFNVLTATELQQMSGRAGRRGKDSVGFCIVAPGPFADARVIYEVSKKPAEPLRSAYFASPSTVLNLLKYRNVDDLRFTVANSLGSFLDKKAAKGLEDEALKREEEISRDETLRPDAQKRAQKRVRRMRTEAEQLKGRHADLLEKTLDALRTLGYVEGGGLTQKGYWAAELCTSLVLEIAETIQEGLFEDVTEEVLTGLVASIAGDPHKRYFSLRENPIRKEIFRKLQEVTERVKEVYVHPGNTEVEVMPDAANTVIAWMQAADWPEFASYLRLAGVADGDVARLVSQTADHLNQISRLWQSHPELARCAHHARERILKPPLIEAELE